MWGGKEKRGSPSGAGWVPSLPWGGLSHSTSLDSGLAPSRIPGRPAQLGRAPSPTPLGAGWGLSSPARFSGAASKILRPGTSLVAGPFSRRANEARATRAPPKAGVSAPVAPRVPLGPGVAGRRGKGRGGGLETGRGLGELGRMKGGGYFIHFRCKTSASRKEGWGTAEGRGSEELLSEDKSLTESAVRRGRAEIWFNS